MSRSWKPLLDRILIKQDAGPACHPNSTVAIPEALREKQRPNTGTVLAVGPGRRYEDGQVYPPLLRVGQAVFFTPAELHSKVADATHGECLLVREADIFLAE